MSDVHDIKTRSYNMSRILDKNTGPEMVVRKFLHSNGFRYRLHVKSLPGKPDVVLPKYKTVIFVHGCFWHAHEECKYFKIPKTKSEWWKEKLYGNKIRDKKQTRLLRDMGWNVLIIWECDLKNNISEQTLFNMVTTIKANL